ncbi:MAG: flagellar hook assembly protein FlgD [Deltaproteobacteria bacterium]|nr:flagellar hook assembly protein FlgD [Deltaproteobacteria bacterium]
MQIEGVGQAPATAAAGVKTEEPMGKDAFLKLLVTQLQNQDPLNPMDNTAFVAQLAQFSSLEGITNLGATMKDVAGNINKMQNYGTAGLIGKYVKAEGSRFNYEGNPAGFSYALEGAAAKAAIKVYSPGGSLIRDINLGALDAGYYGASWDGRDNNGNAVAPGEYSFSIDAKDSNGDSVPVRNYVTGLVTGIRFDGAGVSLTVGGVEVSNDKIKEIY